MSDSFRLKSYEFRVERSRTWRELEALVQRCEKRGPGSLSARELARLPVLYRAALSSLSVARSISLDRAVVEYLETLTARAYFVVYRPKQKLLDGFFGFFSHQFPQAVRDLVRPMALAMMIFLVGTLTGFVMTLNDPGAFYSFVDANLAGDRGPQSTREELEDVLYDDGRNEDGGLTFFAAYLFKNNATVGILAFALGGLVGIPVFLLLFNNALMLGAFAAIHHKQDLSLDLWGWLLPHGVTEILAIILCGGAGLAVARGLVFPGALSRIDALRVEGRLAGSVALGCVLLFVIAGLIEGYFRQMVQSIHVRYALALLSTAFWVWYFMLCGRRKSA